MSLASDAVVWEAVKERAAVQMSRRAAGSKLVIRELCQSENTLGK